MSETQNRSKPEGRRHRAKLRQVVTPSLQVGTRLPPSTILGRVLGITPGEGARHMRRVLREDGWATETKWDPAFGHKRTIITARPGGVVQP